MNNPRLAIRYAKSLIDQAKEKDQLTEVYDDMRFLQNTCDNNPGFVALLDSPIMDEHKKNKIIEAVTTGRVSGLTTNFIKLLASKNRESNLPEIISAYIDQYNKLKGIHKAKLTTATQLSNELKDSFINKIKTSNNISIIELETVVDEKLIGGFVLEMDGKLLDASILRDLNDVRKQFQDNEWIHKLR
ncbi:MAG: ATP synthase F1 subunit delta [Ginsengibacter sp.]